jgi:DNA primase
MNLTLSLLTGAMMTKDNIFITNTEPVNKNKFSASLIEEILASLDIVQVLEEEYNLAFDGPSNKGWWQTNCPLPGHRDSTPSFGVNPELGLFKCFGCQETGNLIHFVRKVEGLPFNDAVVKLASIAGIDMHNSNVSTYRALRDIEMTVKNFLESQSDSKLPAGLSTGDFLLALAERMREYERKVSYDKEELNWVESIYQQIDDYDVQGDQRAMSKVWNALGKNMKERMTNYDLRVHNG